MHTNIPLPHFPFMFLIHGQRAFAFSHHATHQHIRELAWGHTYISDPCIMKHEAANCGERLLCQRLIGISFAELPGAFHTSQGSCSIYFRPSHFSSVNFTPCVWWWVTHSPAWKSSPGSFKCNSWEAGSRVWIVKGGLHGKWRSIKPLTHNSCARLSMPDDSSSCLLF